MRSQIFIAVSICFGLHACAQKAAHDTPEAFLARLKKGLTSDSPTYFEENLHLSKTEAQCSPEDGQLCKFQAPVFRFHGGRWKLYARLVIFGDCW